VVLSRLPTCDLVEYPYWRECVHAAPDPSRFEGAREHFRSRSVLASRAV